MDVIKTAGWAVIRDKTLNKEYDAAHMLSPMPIAITLGVGSNAIPYTAPAIENINGQAITLSIKHKDKRDPKSWKGFKFAVPFDYSMHNYLLRYYVAEHGLDPDQDIQIRAVPPPEMVANLRADNIDGFLGPDPMNQRAVYDGVGFIHVLSKEIWDGHPCCVFAASKDFVTQTPNTYAALLKAIIDATAFAHQPENRKQIAEAIAPANYINQPVTVLEQILTGTYADGLGTVKTDANRVDFDPFPWQSFAVWIITQMKRWGQIKGDVDYKGVAEQVFLATDTSKLMTEVGMKPPTATTKTFVVMGKTFDPGKPEEYLRVSRSRRRSECRRHRLPARGRRLDSRCSFSLLVALASRHARDRLRDSNGSRNMPSSWARPRPRASRRCPASRCRCETLGAPAPAVLRQRPERQGRRHSARVLDRSRDDRLPAGRRGGGADRVPDRHVAVDEQGTRSVHSGPQANFAARLDAARALHHQGFRACLPYS